MPTPDDLEREHTLTTAVVRYNELRGRDAFATTAAEMADEGQPAEVAPLTREGPWSSSPSATWSSARLATAASWASGRPGSPAPHGPRSCLLYTSPSPRDRTRSRMP